MADEPAPCMEVVLECLAKVREVQDELHRSLLQQAEFARRDRIQIARLLVLVGRLLDGQGKAADGAEQIAENLALSIERADSQGSKPGKAADAAARSAKGTT